MAKSMKLKICPYCKAENGIKNSTCHACKKPLIEETDAVAGEKETEMSGNFGNPFGKMPERPVGDPLDGIGFDSVGMENGGMPWNEAPGPDLGGTKTGGISWEEELDKTMESCGDGGTKNNPSVKIQHISQEDLGDCRYLKVEINYNVLVFSGYSSSIDIRLTKLDDKLDDVEVYWAPDGEEWKLFPLHVELRRGDPISFSSGNFKLLNPGDVSARFIFVCWHGGENSHYFFDHRIHVYDSNESHGNYTVYIDNSAKGEATIVNDVTNKIVMDRPRTPNEMRTRLGDIPPQFGSKKLFKPRDEDTTLWQERLLMTIGSRRICVLGKSVVKLGRQRALNDIQVHMPGVEENEEPYVDVSRQHGVLEINDDGGILYKDNSSHGTWVGRPDDVKYRRGSWIQWKEGSGEVLGSDHEHESCRLPSDRTMTLGIYWLPLDVRSQKCAKEDGNKACQACVVNGGCVSSLLMTRRDEVGECYLMVPHCCRLGDFFPEMKGFTLYYQNRRFGLAVPSGGFRGVHPGVVVRENHVTVAFKDYVQL